MQNLDTKSLFVALVGRPNVGKSSLLNLLVGEKVAIVTSKPQTTRTRITGILTRAKTQFVFLDTPGIHKPRTKLGERMAKATSDSVAEVDVAVMLFEPYGELTESERSLIEELRAKKMPSYAVVNKMDTLKRAQDFEIRKEFLDSFGVFEEILPLSVYEKKGDQVLLDKIERYAIESPHYFPDDSYTDMPEKVLVAEIVREKMLLHLYDEIPHGTAVMVERFKERSEKDIIDIDINIYVKRKVIRGLSLVKAEQC
ncbi:GTPase Era [uncultured Ruthenibacterium sp.]|uniref:GTPase Era n=1 Tax=uncultured Ruthenibacterium sp. TaxID=1905347 RepID=UPI00349E84DD